MGAAHTRGMARSGGEERQGGCGIEGWGRASPSSVFFQMSAEAVLCCVSAAFRVAFAGPSDFSRRRRVWMVVSLPPPPSDAHRQPPGAQQPARQDQPRACQLSACLQLRPSTMGSPRLFSRLSSSALQSLFPLCPHDHPCGAAATEGHPDVCGAAEMLMR